MPRRPPAVARVLERVTKTAREHEMFGPGDLVLVACSGGPDSVCLLYSLWHLRRLFKIRLAVFHFDHKLRPDSARDGAYVRNLAMRLQLPFHFQAADEEPWRGVSVEVWARSARMRASGQVAQEIGAQQIADGHTLDDQAETILMALILGWGLDGLDGVHPIAGKAVRPLLDVNRDDVEAFCRALRLRPRRDPMNADTSFLRNAIRLEAIPAIERATGRRVRETFARTAEHLRHDSEALWSDTEEHVRQLVEPQGGGFRIMVEPLLALPRALAPRVVRRGFQITDLNWDHETIAAVLDLAAGRPGRRRDLLLGLKAIREKEYVRVSRSSPPSPES
jgi:tRNA(Ile)-lysidine synthase